MLKRLLRKNHIGLVTGLMILLISNPAFAIPPKPISIGHLAFSNNSSQIFYLDTDARPLAVKAINASNGKPVSSTRLSVKGRILGFTPDGFKTALLKPEGLSILHNQTGKVLRTLKVPSLPWPALYSARTAITNKSGSAQLFHSANKRVLNVLHTGNGKILAEIKLPKGTLNSMGISQNGRIVSYAIRVSATKSELQLYDIYQKKVTKSLDLPRLWGSSYNLDTLIFSPDGKYLWVGNILVDLSTEKATEITINKRTTPAIFTPNGRYLLVPYGKGQVLRYDLRSKQKHGINLGFSSRCSMSQAVDISPDAKLIAYGSSCPRLNNKSLFISILNAADGSFARKLTLTP